MSKQAGKKKSKNEAPTISLSLNFAQWAWLEAQMGEKPTSAKLKKWLKSGGSLAGMPDDLPRGGQRIRQTPNLKN